MFQPCPILSYPYSAKICIWLGCSDSDWQGSLIVIGLLV